MRILKDGICLDEKRLFSDVYNRLIREVEKSEKPLVVNIPIFTDDELDVLDSEFDFYEGDIEEAELINRIMYHGDDIVWMLDKDRERQDYLIFAFQGTVEYDFRKIERPY